MKKYVAIFAATATLLLTLSACSTASSVTPPPPQQSAQKTETPPAPEVGTRENPAPLGSEVKGDTWTVKINSVKFDATKDIEKAQNFAFSPDDGNVWAMVNATYTYTGAEKNGGMPVEVQLQIVTADGQSVGDMVLVTPPKAINLTKNLYEGATVTGNLALEIPADVATAKGNLLSVTPGVVSDVQFVATS